MTLTPEASARLGDRVFLAPPYYPNFLTCLALGPVLPAPQVDMIVGHHLEEENGVDTKSKH